ncbi:ABC transporter permease [uncultured Clostridium sp.]|jgi:putative ABC transport system permease protein|uniref:ABC transporter permease n=1 Tax=uncultured Clostridium sp. TaxID=59620 RepID=UPI0026232646|nr:ABC transporter permease [uncultured Clostridium sp.]
MGIKYVKISLKKNIFLNIILIFQLALGIYAIYNSIILGTDIKNESQDISKYFNNGDVYNLRINNSDMIYELEKNELKKIDDFYNELDNINGISILYNQRLPINISVFEGYQNLSEFDGTFNEGGEKKFQAQTIFLSPNFFEIFDLKVSDGESLIENKIVNSNEDSNLFLVGKNFAKEFPIGSTIEHEWNEDNKPTRGKVVGILEENQKIPYSIFFNGKEYVNLDNTIVALDSQLDIKGRVEGRAGNNLIFFDENLKDEKILEIKKQIVDEFKKFNLNVGVIDGSKVLNSELNISKQKLEIYNMMSIVILITVSITFIISLLNSIEKRKKEFGIYVLNGARLKDIAMIIFAEIIFMVGSAYLVFNLYLQTLDIHINGILVIFIGLLLLIYSLVTMLIPLRKIFKYSIQELVKGDE